MPGRLHDSDYAVFARHLAHARQEQGITQADLAGRLGRPQPYISKIERLERRLDIGEWVGIIRALGLDPVDELERALTATGQPPSQEREGSSLAGKAVSGGAPSSKLRNRRQ